MRQGNAGQARLTILIIEDDPVLGPALLQRLRLEGHEARLVTSGAQAQAFAAVRRPDAVFSDIRLPDMNGEDIWRTLVDVCGPLPTWFMTAYGEVEQAVRLVKAGARDYLTKPVDVDALVAALEGLCSRSVVVPAGNASALAPLSRSASPAMAALAAQLAKAARTDLPVLLSGETGSGKEVAARGLHAASNRDGKPFVALNCAAIPRDLAESLLFGHEKGAFTGAAGRHVGAAEEAADGTLFLDEIGELPLDIQPKLLRLIEARSFRPLGVTGERPFRARIVAASHADLSARVRQGAFREDLFFRVNVITLSVPPLRERREDIVQLASMFMEEAFMRSGGRLGSAPRLAPAAGAALLSHGWPGNVRELRNRIERAVAMADGTELGEDDIFPETYLDAAPFGLVGSGETLDVAAREAIRARVRDALAAADGNQTLAARMLGVSRTTVWKYSR